MVATHLNLGYVNVTHSLRVWQALYGLTLHILAYLLSQLTARCPHLHDWPYLVCLLVIEGIHRGAICPHVPFLLGMLSGPGQGRQELRFPPSHCWGLSSFLCPPYTWKDSAVLVHQLSFLSLSRDGGRRTPHTAAREDPQGLWPLAAVRSEGRCPRFYYLFQNALFFCLHGRPFLKLQP